VLAFVERRLENKKSVERKFAASRPQSIGGVDVMGIQQGELTISEVALLRHVVPLRHPECDEPGCKSDLCKRQAKEQAMHERFENRIEEVHLKSPRAVANVGSNRAPWSVA
jgi:hypothetical protein